MQLTLNQKLFSLTGKTSVVDGAGTQVYFTKGKIFSFFPTYYVYDLNENLVIALKRRYFHPLGKFTIHDAADERIGVMKGRLHWPLTRRFRMSTPYGNYYVVEGKWNSKAYLCNEGSWKFDKKNPVLRMHKNFFHIRDRFFVDFDETRMHPIVATLIGLCNDMIFHNG